MSCSVQQMVEFLADRTAWVIGNLPGRSLIEGVAPVTPGRLASLSFIKSTNDEEVDRVLANSTSSVVIVGQGVRVKAPDQKVLVAVADPRREFVRTLRQFFYTDPEPDGIHPSAVLGQTVEVGRGTTVGANAVVEEGVIVGRDCRIGPGVVLRSGTRIGDRVEIGANTTLGESGFGFVREADGESIRVPHLGGVVIESDVEIGANAAIDRGTLEDTIVRRGAKIDNLVHIAHNCDIGSETFVIATAIVSGSVRIGARSWIAPNASILQGVTVGSDATVGLGATVIRDVASCATVVGNPARAIAQEHPSHQSADD